MASADYIYYFTKNTFKKTLYGEIQKGFNMGLVIDGTKDSLKVQVISFSNTEIEPYTICWHEKTNTWWVVAHDKVERDTNENGFIYTHNVQLLGAIELLNARDLTDCGFNQNAYSISDIIFRLCRLSNWEFANDNRLSIEILSSQLDDNMKVDYMKTFENYTLLSALREFLDGYNCDVKLTFDMQIDQETWGDNNYHLSVASFNIVPKTGRSNKTPYSESEFKDIRETKTMDKNSFGTTVISNAENVVSTKTKTYPSTGAVRLSGSQYEINAENAFIRLPSNIFKVNWVRAFFPITIYIEMRIVGALGDTRLFTGSYTFYSFDENMVNTTYEKIITDAYDYMAQAQTFDDATYKQGFELLVEHYKENKDSILKPILLGGRSTLYSGWKFNPVDGSFGAPDNNDDFYFTMIYRSYNNSTHISPYWLIGEKEQSNGVGSPERCLSYEKGKNVIDNFSILAPVASTDPFNYSYIVGYQCTDLRDGSYNPNTGSTAKTYYNDTFNIGIDQFIFKIDIKGLPTTHIDIGNTYYQVNYIPMTDLKIKYDNSGERNDTQLYNQNGKLNDGVALSKLMLSYSKEIESDTITKYSNYYDYSKVPQCGDLVSIGNDIYVINNVSLDFEQNETSNNKDYFISGEFTMSKKTSVKSLLTNPNTNIRDYGIPQNNNVVRKQLYRDFYELGHTSDTNANEDYYLPLNKIMNVSNYYQDYQEHIAVIKLGYSDLVDNHSHWYYQLDTTTYMLKKAIYEVVNFNDNNIIGYSSQNTLSEFDISRVFTGNIDVKNTPISYTDYNGNVESFEILFCTNEQLTGIYDNYKQANGYGSYLKPIFNYSVFIDEDIYEGGDYGQCVSYWGIIDTGSLTKDSVWGFRYELTQYLGNYEGDGSDIGIGSLQVVSGLTSTEIPSSEYTYTFTKSGNKYYINVVINQSSTYDTPTATLYITNVLRGGFDGAKDIHDFKIEELQYNKDALEVPFFEYSCQIDDSNDVIVGDNVLDTKDDGYTYMYSYVLVPKNQVNENSFTRYVVEPSGQYSVDDDFFIYIPNSIGMRYENDKLYIGLRTNDSYDLDSETFTQGGTITIDSTLLNQLKTHDIMVVRHKVNKHTDIEEIEPEEGVFWYKAHPINDLMFVIRNTNNLVVENNEIVLTINHYTIH